MDATEPQAVETPPLGNAPAPDEGDGAAVSTPAADDDSLAAHIAAHHPEQRERDEQGRFQPKPQTRRRAASQQAEPDDVPVINELTRRLKAAEDAAGKDIVRKDGESERVFTLRRRAEIAERLAKPAETPKPAPVHQPVSQPRQSQPLPDTFPAYEAFVAIPGNEAVDYDTYRDIRDDWGYQRRRQFERQQEAAEREQRTQAERATAHQTRVRTARTRYTDWDTVVTNDVPVSRVIHDAVLASEKSADVQYYLGQHRDDLMALNAESQDYSPSAVAAMRRYLDSLVASATSSPSSQRAVADPTGAVPALPARPASRPPTPVRTSAVAVDEPPDPDGQSLAAHEQHYGRRKR